MLKLHWQNGNVSVLKTDGSFAGEKVQLLHAAFSRDGRVVRHLIANQRFPSRKDRLDPCSRRLVPLS